jgi:hypothetical protein
MRRFMISLIFISSLSAAVFAGDIPSDGSPSPAQAQIVRATPGEIPASGAPEQVSSEALSVALSLLSFLVR